MNSTWFRNSNWLVSIAILLTLTFIVACGASAPAEQVGAEKAVAKEVVVAPTAMAGQSPRVDAAIQVSTTTTDSTAAITARCTATGSASLIARQP